MVRFSASPVDVFLVVSPGVETSRRELPVHGLVDPVGLVHLSFVVGRFELCEQVFSIYPVENGRMYE